MADPDTQRRAELGDAYMRATWAHDDTAAHQLATRLQRLEHGQPDSPDDDPRPVA